MKILCSIRNLVWRQGDKKILDIDYFDIKQGERVAVIGANGAGKSSLIKVLTYLIRDIEGELKYPAFEKKSEMDIRRSMSVVFQDPNLLKGKVDSNITIGLRLRKIDKREIDRRLDFWLKEFRILHLAKRNSQTLSKGEAQRVSLARAMIIKPKFLLLDEPFSNLDVPTRSEILVDLTEITKKQNTTLIMITHYPAEIPIISDRVIVLDQGKLIEEGTPYQVLEQPKHRITAKLVGIDNIYKGKVSKTHVQIGGMGRLMMVNKLTDNDILYSEDTEADIFIKPDMLRLSNGQDFNIVDFGISKIIPMHDSVNLYSNDLDLLFRMSRSDFMKRQFYVNQIIKIHIPPEAMLLGYAKHKK